MSTIDDIMGKRHPSPTLPPENAMWISTPEDLAQAVRDRRRHLRMSQRSLALLVGVSRQWIVALEHAKPTAEVGLILKTLSSLGLRIDIRDPDYDATPRAETLRAATAQVLGRARADGAAVRRLPTTARRRTAPGTSRSTADDPGAAEHSGDGEEGAP
jgi:HTH-type transcriptional regulator/antitoxin HipB